MKKRQLTAKKNISALMIVYYIVKIVSHMIGEIVVLDVFGEVTTLNMFGGVMRLGGIRMSSEASAKRKYDYSKCLKVSGKHCKDHNDGLYCTYCIGWLKGEFEEDWYQCLNEFCILYPQTHNHPLEVEK